MIKSRFVIATFCDDVRQEVGNKVSLIGCYGSDLIVEGFPAVLPKLFIYVQAVTPLDTMFSNLKLRTDLNGDTIAELNVPCDLLNKPRDEAKNFKALAIMSFSPLVITEPSTLKVIAETEDGDFYGGSLWIRERDSSLGTPRPKKKRKELRN